MAISDVSNAATVHPERQVFHAMPRPPLHIWVRPHNWSLQLLYLSTFVQLLRVLQQKSRVMSTTPISSIFR